MRKIRRGPGSGRSVIILNRVIWAQLVREVTLSTDLTTVTELGMWTSGTEARARAKTLQPKRAWWMQRARRPVGLGWSRGNRGGHQKMKSQWWGKEGDRGGFVRTLTFEWDGQPWRAFRNGEA